MRWVFVALVACVAVATANLFVDDDNSFGEQQNNIGIFLPRSLDQGQMDRAIRAFYYKYWLYPAMGFKSRVPYMGMSPYAEYNYMEPLTFKDVFEKPVFVVTPSQDVQNTFSMFYLHNGLRTLHHYNSFTWLQEFFNHPGLKGLIFYPHLIYNVRFFDTPVASLILQEDLRMSDFVGIEDCNNGKIPYMFVAPEDLFDSMHFENIAKVSDLKVYNDAIELQPIVAQPRPVYNPFYGTQSSQQGNHFAPPQPSGSDSSMNTMDFRAPNEEFSFRPQVLVQSDKLVASQGGRAHADMAYGSQNGYGQNQGIDSQYNVNYGQGKFGSVEIDRVADAAQTSSNSYNPRDVLGSPSAMSKAALVGSAYGASKDASGILAGSRTGVQLASVPSSGAQFGVTQNTAQPQVHGQIHHHGTSKESENKNAQGAQVGIPRVEGIEGQLEQSLGVTVKTTENILRTDSGNTQEQRVGATNGGVSIFNVSGQRSVASGSMANHGSLSRTNSGVQASQQSAILFPKEGGTEGLAGAGMQGGVVDAGSVSRTGPPSVVEDVTESQASGHSQAHASGSSLQSGNLVRTESANFEGQAGVQGGMFAAANAGSNSRTNTGGAEQVTETLSFFGTTDQTGKLVRTEGNFGGSIGIQGGPFGGNIGIGGLDGGFGLSGNVGGGLLKLGSDIVRNIDVTTHGLGVDQLRHHKGDFEKNKQSDSISSSSSTSRSVGSSSIAESSTLSGLLEVSEQESSRSAESVGVDSPSVEDVSPVMITKAIAA